MLRAPCGKFKHLEKNKYLHSYVINEANPSDRVFQKNVNPFLERFSPFMMKHIFRFESLINGKIYWIIRIRDSSRFIFIRTFGYQRFVFDNVRNWIVRVREIVVHLFIIFHVSKIRTIGLPSFFQTKSGF